MLTDEIKKLLLAGIGAAAIAVEKSGDTARMLIEKGRMTLGQGRVPNEELRRKCAAAAQPDAPGAPQSDPVTDETLARTLERMGYVRADELQSLAARVEALEKRGGEHEDSGED
ncbi:MAG: hypothetical protein ACOX7W_06785 [Christensenellales bacterium]|jgi:polyhydroxyalkanoate synthesis regulator phasin